MTTMKCPACGGANVSRALDVHVVINVADGVVYPDVLVVKPRLCKDCGFVMTFAANSADLAKVCAKLKL